MHIAILHYHLNRGGVTQVVLNQLRAFNAMVAGGADYRFALVFGGRHEGVNRDALTKWSDLDVSLCALGTLDYDDGQTPRPVELAAEIRRELEARGFTAETTLLHVHNHSLGKNLSLPGALRILAQDGYRLLLQIHDFAEDFRPDNFRRITEGLGGTRDQLAALLYPQASQIHYAVLNCRDRAILRQAGVDERRLHTLPNAVSEFGDFPSRELARDKLQALFDVPANTRYFIYPVRGIRRKNLGEAILWSVLGSQEFVVGLTLPPLNPIEQTSYRRWRRFVAEHNLSCVFETGVPEGMPFKENLVASDSILTTSVAEGFGLVFLESWLASRPLVGRDLPDITSDFVAAGLRLDALQPRLSIPVSWIKRDRLADSLHGYLERLLEAYGLDCDHHQTSVVKRIAHAETVDFAQLESGFQREVIELVAGDRRRREELLDLNPGIATALSSNSDAELVDQNASIVRTEYSVAGAGQQLSRVYRAVADSAVDTRLRASADGARVLDAFLDPAQLYPIRFED